MNETKDTARTMEQKIKAEAMRLGFSLCGITDVQPPKEYTRYESWLKCGFQAGMTYMTSERHRHFRRDPSRLLPEARSIICLGYLTPLRKPELDEDSNEAWVAGYTGKTDYHDLLMQKMGQLEVYIRSITDSKVLAKSFTDNAPILERELAVRAGLGWIGRNSCFISPEFGSGVLLSEIFLNLPLIPDNPFLEDRCGSCRRCIEACPTGCIMSGRVIDSNRCVSYLTIENKGGISEALREKMGNWFFGCDTCQMVCPWNQSKAIHEGSQNWTPRQLIDILKISPEEYSKKYKDTAFSRAKRFGLQRNALVWLGNHIDSVDVQLIEDFILDCEYPELIEIAGWVLERAGK